MLKVTSHRATFRYHPRFGYFFRPNLRLWQLPHHETAPFYLISTNSVGARCYREPEPNIDDCGIKILFIGDSLAAGDSVSNRERFTDVLEQLLPGAESHNYGLSGTGHDQQLLIHREFAPLIDPDVLVLCPAIGCIGRNLLTDRLHYDPLTGGGSEFRGHISHLTPTALWFHTMFLFLSQLSRCFRTLVLKQFDPIGSGASRMRLSQ